MTATTIILLICAVVITLAFILLTAYLLPALLKLRDLMSEVEATAVEVRQLAVSLQKTSGKVNQDLERVDEILDSSRSAVKTVSKAVRHMDRAMMTRSAGFIALLPAIKLGWRLVKKIKGGR